MEVDEIKIAMREEVDNERLKCKTSITDDECKFSDPHFKSAPFYTHLSWR
jgi:hypothetical protein